MPAVIGSVLIHSFIYKSYMAGTAFWYAVRGTCRIYDPKMVVGWFRPPAQAHLETNDLELYNVRTDAFCLMTLSGILVSALDLVPKQMNSPSVAARALVLKPYAKALVAWTMFHHVTTAFGSYSHYKHDTHYNKSMGIGVWVNAFLTAVGGTTLYYIW